MTNDVLLDELSNNSCADQAPTKAGDLKAALPERRRTQLFLIAFVLAAACALVDFSLGPLFEWLRTSGAKGIEVAYFFGLLGCTLAQGNLLAAWLVWSEGPFLRRLGWHWVAAAVLFLAWTLGLALAALPKEAQIVWLAIGLVVPVVSLAAQFPLWATRQWLGWRITLRAAELETSSQERPLTIRGLMGAMVIVGVSLTLARVVARLLPVPVEPREKEFWAAWIVGFSAATGISTIGMLPAGRMLLGMQRFRSALVWSGAYAASLISLIWIARELMIRYALNGGPPVIGCAMLSSLMLGYAATLVVAGSVARALGYRLVRGRQLRY